MLLNVIPEGKVPLNLDGKSKISGKVTTVYYLLISYVSNDYKTCKTVAKISELCESEAKIKFRWLE